MRQLVLVLLMALGLLAASCASDDGEGVASLAAAEDPEGVSPSTQDEDDAPIDQEQAMLDFAACMRDNGVEIDDPTVDSDGNLRFGGFRGVARDRETIQIAMEACSDYLEGIALGRGGGDFDPTELQDTLVEYAACMRDNGYDMPDPDFSNFGPGGGEPGQGGGGPFGQIDPEDPDFIAAQEACEDVLGGVRAPGGPRPGGTAG